jgi:hypothetical protein
MKTPLKTEPASKPKAADTLITVAEAVLAYRNEKRVTLALLSRIMNRASGMLRINDIDERMELENAATLTLAKKLGGCCRDRVAAETKISS